MSFEEYLRKVEYALMINYKYPENEARKFVNKYITELSWLFDDGVSPKDAAYELTDPLF